MNLLRYFKRPKLGQKGQSIVEIGLITPLLLVALYIPADFGIAFFMGNMVATAAREGARIGSGLPKPAGGGGDKEFSNAEATIVQNETLNRMPNNPRVSNQRVIVTFYEGTAVPANCMEVVEVTAEVTYNYFLHQLIRLFGGSAPNTTVITRTTQMRYNYQIAGNDTVCTSMSVDHADSSNP